MERRKKEMPEDGFISRVSNPPALLPTLTTSTANMETESPTPPDPTQQQPTSKPQQADEAEKSNNKNPNNNNNNNKEEAEQNNDEQVEAGSTTDLKELIDEVWVRSVELKLTYLSRLARRLNHIDIRGLEKTIREVCSDYYVSLYDSNKR